MKIWVDADACPGPIKELIVRAAKRLGINIVFVANKYIGLPQSSYLTSVRIGVDPEAVRSVHHQKCRAVRPGEYGSPDAPPTGAQCAQRQRGKQEHESVTSTVSFSEGTIGFGYIPYRLSMPSFLIAGDCI